MFLVETHSVITNMKMEVITMASQIPTSDVTSDDKLWAALAYVLTPLVPIILLLLEDKKKRPFIRAHNAQALAWGVAYYIIAAITSPIVGLGCVLGLLCFILSLYWAYKAYQGEYITIPIITDFVKKQGWA
jgi:uncharacterized membrane protein